MPAPLLFSEILKWEHCWISYHKTGWGTCIMGLLKQEPGKQKDNSKIYKIPMFS